MSESNRRLDAKIMAGPSECKDRKLLGYRVYIGYPVKIKGRGQNFTTSTEVIFEVRWRSLAEALSDHLSANNVSSYVHKIFEPLTLDYADISDVEVDGIDHADCPDYVDAYISSATYKGRSMTEAELEVLTEDGGFLGNAIHSQLY